jgi:phosphoglycolate phosphatase-like HAD superfamily hydrolase
LITVIVIQSSWAQTNPISSPRGNQSSVDPLSSWKDGVIKQNIIEFVHSVTNPENTEYYVVPEDRIAVFDNDGTLWAEKPLYFQAYFTFDRVPHVVATRLELKQISPFKEILEKNFSALEHQTEKDVMDLMATTHSNITQAEFDNLVQQWAKTAKHPQTKRLFVDMVYQPMLELLNFLKANGFKNFIVSGGGIDFIRDALSSVYGIPAERIIGSSGKYQFFNKFSNNSGVGLNNSKSFIYRLPELGSIDDKYGKPVNFQLHIGKTPVIAVGNSDGDLQMLEFVNDNNPRGKSLEILVHHDDPVREFSYDKGAEKALEQAMEQNWNIVSMKDDFLNIFPAENSTEKN